jgi:cyclophilin family peptidyl-prolyl cis-trans isomerase
MESAAKDDYKPAITHTAVLKTALGDITLELYGEDAPKTVANFVGLAKKGTYDGVLFHRVVKDFVIQGGDPKSKDPAMEEQWGTGGTSIYDGKEFEDELNPDAPSYKRGYVEGAVAMANRGPNTNTSQFFIMTSTKGADALPHKYTIFGYVRGGMDVVRAIEANGQGAPPQNPVEIEEVSVDEQ